MSRNEAYSYDHDDGNSYQAYGHSQDAYRDSPERPTLRSPPPQYLAPSAVPLEPISPVSAHRPNSTHSHQSSNRAPSMEAPRRSLIITNNNIPPMPPVHRTSPTRSSFRPDPSVAIGMAHGGYDTADGYQQQSSVDHGQFSERTSPSRQSNYSIPRRPISRTYAGGSSHSAIPLATSAATPGASSPYAFSNDGSSSRHSVPHSYYAMGPNPADHYDSPYHRHSHYQNAVPDADILPQNIVDDDDDGFLPSPKRKSFLPSGRERSRENVGHTGATTAGATAGATVAAGTLGGLFARKEKNVSSSGSYNVVASSEGFSTDKSEWLSRQTKGNNKMRWVVGSIIAIVAVLAIIGGVVGGILGSKKSSGGGDGNIQNAADDTAANGDLGANSAEIEALMNNKNLHKVFPGMDYTPWGVQYPDCLVWPPSQNNVTRDMAVLSQLTNAVRLYGNDCNQTEMVLHAIDRLHLTDMKVWLGVWIDTNTTTNTRQIDELYKILEDTKDKPGHDIFKGVIVGNEALFRAGEDKSTAHTELVDMLDQVRSNFSSLQYSLSVSTSDLGDNWDATLAKASDNIMSNIHPFFAGVAAEDAAAWTWDFWQTHDVVLNGDESKNFIAETGWPSGGGTDCGNTANVCAAGQTGSVASVENMNIFMQDWVCQALANGTNYFWFSAFDEAWKVRYNTPGKEWEDKWGLMDTARNLKSGLKIPDCGGKTVP